MTCSMRAMGSEVGQVFHLIFGVFHEGDGFCGGAYYSICLFNCSLCSICVCDNAVSAMQVNCFFEFVECFLFIYPHVGLTTFNSFFQQQCNKYSVVLVFYY